MPNFPGFHESLPNALREGTAPSGMLRKVTPDDDADLPDGVCRALLVGTAGACSLIDATGEELTDVPLQQGYNPIAVARVLEGGDADNIWALY